MRKNIAVIGCGYWGKNLVRKRRKLRRLCPMSRTDSSTSKHRIWRYILQITTLVVVGIVILSIAFCGCVNKQANQPILVKKISVKGFGAWSGLCLGDLSGDGKLDILIAQNKGQIITCLTAINIEGKRLWQIGKPCAENYMTKFDLPLQIYDIDGDGRNEVICVMNDDIMIINGRDGSIKKSAALPSNDACDCIVIANFRGNVYPQDILVKNRYTKVWALDQDLRVLWSYAGNTGHYPWPHDFDGDGYDESCAGMHCLVMTAQRNGKRNFQDIVMPLPLMT